MTEITIKRELEFGDGLVVKEITIFCIFRPGSDSYFDKRHGNWLPGNDEEFTFDSSTILIDGETPTQDQCQEIISNEKLLLQFRDQLRKDMEN